MENLNHKNTLTSNCFNEVVLSSRKRVALPIATYPGLALTGATVRDIVTNPAAQLDAQARLHERYGQPFALSAMDLSAEAEAFGCQLHLEGNEIPSIVGRLVTSTEEARKLSVPKPGDRRTAVYLETVRLLKGLPGSPLVLGGCIGPFSLAARIVGVSEALELTLADPDLMREVLRKSTEFLSAYAKAFKSAGADGLIMAEPAAGLLSPRGLAEFSTPYIREISQAMGGGRFSLILHNCAAKIVHLPAILETGLKTFHFGAPMDMGAALTKVGADTVLCGNLDPTGVFCQLPPEQVKARALGLVAAAAGRKNFVLSSGCDLPPGTPMASLDALYAVAAEAR